MNINPFDTTKLLSHLLLQDTGVATAVAETSQWKEDGEVVCTVQFNGVELPAEKLEEVLAHFVKQIEDKVGLTDLNQKAEERAREILSERASDLIGKLDQLQMVVSAPEMFIKPHWEE